MSAIDVACKRNCLNTNTTPAWVALENSSRSKRVSVYVHDDAATIIVRENIIRNSIRYAI